GDSIGMINLWDVSTGLLVRELTGHGYPVYDLAVTREGRTVYTASGGSILVWDMAAAKAVRAKITDPSGVPSIALSADGTRLVTATVDAVKVWNTVQDNSPKLLSRVNAFPVAAISPDGRFVAVGDWE